MLSFREDRGRGFVRGSISLARVIRKCLNERPGICGLLGLGDSNLYGGTAEVPGLLTLKKDETDPANRVLAAMSLSFRCRLSQKERNDRAHAHREEPKSRGWSSNRAQAAQFPGGRSRVEHLFVLIGLFESIKYGSSAGAVY